MSSRKLKSVTGKPEPASRESIEFVPRRLSDIPIRLMEKLHYSPGVLEKEPGAKAFAHLGTGRKARLEYLLTDVWPKEEMVVNRVLESVLLAMPPGALGAAIGKVAQMAPMKHPLVVKIKRPGSVKKQVVGAPDFVLFDEDTRSLVLGEMKIGGKASNGRYDFEQLQKYMRLALLCRGATNVKTIAHLLVTPTEDISQHCKDSEYWAPSVKADGRLYAGLDRFATTGVQYRVDLGRIGEGIEGFNIEKAFNDVDKASPAIPVPSYVASWEKLCSAMTEACRSGGAGHLVGSIEHLRRMGEGRFQAVDSERPRA